MPREKKVYVIGQAGLEEELDNLGIARCGGTVRIVSLRTFKLINRIQRIESSLRAWIGRPSNLMPTSELFFAGLTLMSVRRYIPGFLTPPQADMKTTRSTAKHTRT